MIDLKIGFFLFLLSSQLFATKNFVSSSSSETNVDTSDVVRVKDLEFMAKIDSAIEKLRQESKLSDDDFKKLKPYKGSNILAEINTVNSEIFGEKNSSAWGSEDPEEAIIQRKLSDAKIKIMLLLMLKTKTDYNDLEKAFPDYVMFFSKIATFKESSSRGESGAMATIVINDENLPLLNINEIKAFKLFNLNKKTNKDRNENLNSQLIEEVQRRVSNINENVLNITNPENTASSSPIEQYDEAINEIRRQLEDPSNRSKILDNLEGNDDLKKELSEYIPEIKRAILNLDFKKKQTILERKNMLDHIKKESKLGGIASAVSKKSITILPSILDRFKINYFNKDRVVPFDKLSETKSTKEKPIGQIPSDSSSIQDLDLKSNDGLPGHYEYEYTNLNTLLDQANRRTSTLSTLSRSTSSSGDNTPRLSKMDPMDYSRFIDNRKRRK